MDYKRVKLNMFDDYWLDYRPGTIRRWFTPSFESIYKDDNYKANIYSSMHYIPEKNKYFLWYEVCPDLRDDAYRLLAMAESNDGLHFEPLNLYPDREQALRNIAVNHSGVHGSSVFYDQFEQDPEKRFKFIGMTHTSKEERAKANSKNMPVYVEYSADGINFTDDRTRLAHPFTSDAFNSMYFNPYDKTYNLILRGGFLDRRIALRTSKDMINWTDPQILMHPSPAQNNSMLQTQYYSMAVNFIDGIFYGLLWRYYTDITAKAASKMAGIMEAELVYSYDGKTFMPTTGAPIFERPCPPAYGCFQQDMMGITPTKDGLSYILYGAGMRMIHGTGDANALNAIRMGGHSGANIFYKIRRDGFCGLEGVFGRAEVVTKPLMLQSDNIEFNINASAGLARVSFYSADNKPIEGFDFDDCIPLENDDTAWKPRFLKHNINELVGKRIRITIELKCSILHCITMDAAPYIKGPQRSFADPMQMC